MTEPWDKMKYLNETINIAEGWNEGGVWLDMELDQSRYNDSMGSQRVGCDLVTEQQQRYNREIYFESMHII